MDQGFESKLPDGLQVQQATLDPAGEDPIPPGVTKISPERLKQLREDLARVKELTNTYTEVAQELNTIAQEREASSKFESTEKDLQQVCKDLDRVFSGSSKWGRKQKEYERAYDGLPTDSSDGFLYFGTLWIQPLFMLGGGKVRNSSYISPMEVRETFLKVPEQLNNFIRKYKTCEESSNYELPGPIRIQKKALLGLQSDVASSMPDVSSWKAVDKLTTKEIEKIVDGWRDNYYKLQSSQNVVDRCKQDFLYRERLLQKRCPDYFSDLSD